MTAKEELKHGKYWYPHNLSEINERRRYDTAYQLIFGSERIKFDKLFLLRDTARNKRERNFWNARIKEAETLHDRINGELPALEKRLSIDDYKEIAEKGRTRDKDRLVKTLLDTNLARVSLSILFGHAESETDLALYNECYEALGEIRLKLENRLNNEHEVK